MVPSAARGGSTRANQRVALYGDTPGAEGSLIAAVRARHAATAVRRFEEMRHGWFSRGDASASAEVNLPLSVRHFLALFGPVPVSDKELEGPDHCTWRSKTARPHPRRRLRATCGSSRSTRPSPTFGASCSARRKSRRRRRLSFGVGEDGTARLRSEWQPESASESERAGGRRLAPFASPWHIITNDAFMTTIPRACAIRNGAKARRVPARLEGT